MKALSAVKQTLLIWFALSLWFGAVTLPSLLVARHFASNLEPYPDGLLYALSARNAVAGKGWQLVHDGTTLVPWVPPAYSWVLAIGYGLNAWPMLFVATNVGLGIATIGLVVATVQVATRRWLMAALAGLAFVTQAHVLWLPTVPMSENLLLFLIAGGVFLLVKYPLSRLGTVSLAGVVGGIVLTRYAAVVSAGTLGLLAGWQWYHQSAAKGKLLATGIGGGLALVAVLQLMGYAPLELMKTVVSELVQPASTSSYFSWQFISRNLVFYGQSLIGVPSQFLWLREPFLTAPLMLLLLVGGYLSWQDKLHRWPMTVIGFMAVAQVALPLVFYSLDARYVIGLLPLVAIGLGVTADSLTKRWGIRWWLVAIGVVVLMQVIQQRQLYRQILAANVLGRSTAWQYEAIKHFDTTLRPGDYLVTALPPYLVDAYRTRSYIVMPLSPHQEFAQKGNQVWFKPLDIAHLPEEIAQLLAAGRVVYISNAYVTHLAAVTADYEALKTKFTFELVTTGCDQTCNVYRLKPLSVTEALE